MSVTAQPLPQHPPAFPPPYTVATRPVDADAALHRDMDTITAQLRALEVTAVRLAEERDRARAEAGEARMQRDQALESGFRIQYENRQLRQRVRDLVDAEVALRTGLRHTRAAAEDAVTALAAAVREIDALREQRAGHTPRPWWPPVRGRGRTGL